MELGQIRVKDLTFPDRAGELQREKATASLIAELGDNYGRYHRFLRDELAKLERPRPEDFADGEAYLRPTRRSRVTDLSGQWLQPFGHPHRSSSARPVF